MLQDREIYIFSGGAAYSGTLKDAGRVSIPTRTWKIAVIMDKDRGIGDVDAASDLEIIAVDMPNTTTVSGGWQQFRTTVDHIEQLTGYDFLALLPDHIETVVASCLASPEAKAEHSVAPCFHREKSWTTIPVRHASAEDVAALAWTRLR